MSNNKIDEKSIFRLAALIYGNSIGDVYASDTLMSMIENAFLDNNNQPMQNEVLLARVLDSYGIIITETEFENIIEKYRSAFVIYKDEGISYYSIDNDLFIELQHKTEKTISYYIDLYISATHESDSVKDTIYKFLYQLTTTNITSYQKMLGGNSISIYADSMITVDASLFSEEEKSQISGFLSWDNDEKNIAVVNIVLCCLEYCLVINGDDANDLSKVYLKERYIYLDTNILFRALGINGVHRKNVVLAFLSKCKQAKMHLLVTSYTKREFFDTVNYYVQMAIKMPTDNIYEDAYDELCDANIFSYFNDWKRKHPDLPVKMFQKYIESSIAAILEQYSIEEDSRSIYDLVAQRKIEEYDRGIRRIKDNDPLYEQQYYGTNKHDAILAFIAESKRNEVQMTNYKADCLIATTDKQFRFWDYSRSTNEIPLVVYPSQLFALLIKICGRSINDMKSFVSFINIKPSIAKLPVIKANVILSAIGSLSDDIRTQKLLVSAVFDDDFQKVIQSAKDEEELYEMSKELGIKIIDAKMEEQAQRLTINENEIQKLKNELTRVEEKRKKDRNEYLDGQTQRENESKKQTELIDKMALEHTRVCYHIFWTVIPIISLVFGITISVLLAIGVWGDKDKNIALRVSEFICSTPLIQRIQDPYAWLIPAAITTAGALLVFGCKRLFFTNRQKKREEYKEKYLGRVKT